MPCFGWEEETINRKVSQVAKLKNQEPYKTFGYRKRPCIPLNVLYG